MTLPKQVTAAGAFLFDHEDRVFLAKCANKFQNQWSIPGGKIQFGEDPLDAVRREVREETNLDIPTFHYLTHGAFTVDNTHVLYIDYVADCPEDYEIKINDEFSEWGFFRETELDTLDIIPKTKETALAAMRFRSKRRFASTMAQFNLGLIRKTVSLQNYQSQWSDAYTWVCAQLNERLSTLKPYRIEHVGSTSIPGLPSKPVLDILLEFSDLDAFQKTIPAIEQLGFQYKGDAVGNLYQVQDETRHFFSFYSNENNIEYIHLHALPKGHAQIDRMLRFRDALRNSPPLIKKYADLKVEFQCNGLSRRDYTRSKSAFVDQVLMQ